jgi:hypothetical protein
MSPTCNSTSSVGPTRKPEEVNLVTRTPILPKVHQLSIPKVIIDSLQFGVLLPPDLSRSTGAPVLRSVHKRRGKLRRSNQSNSLSNACANSTAHATKQLRNIVFSFATDTIATLPPNSSHIRLGQGTRKLNELCKWYLVFNVLSRYLQWNI